MLENPAVSVKGRKDTLKSSIRDGMSHAVMLGAGETYLGAFGIFLQATAMQTWLISGKATGNELVWRSDWSDWKPIALIFPESIGGDQEASSTALSVPRSARSGTIGAEEYP